MEQKQSQFEVKTPAGTLQAVESLDKDNPGVVVMRFDKNGKEKGAIIFEYSEAERCMLLRVYSHEDPDGEPIQVFRMSETI